MPVPIAIIGAVSRLFAWSVDVADGPDVSGTEVWVGFCVPVVDGKPSIVGGGEALEVY